jgi:hypothetical protein
LAVVRPVVDRDPLGDSEPDGVGVVAVRLAELALLLDQPGATARVDEPARARRVDRAVGTAKDDAMLVLLRRGEREVEHGRTGFNRDAAAGRLCGEEVLEQAAVDLVARHRERLARAELGDAVDVASLVGEEEAKAELLQLRVLEVLAQAEDVGEVVGADLDRRLADLVRRDRHGMDTALDDEDVERRERLLELQRKRQSGEAAAGDDDVVPGAVGGDAHERASVATSAWAVRRSASEGASGSASGAPPRSTVAIASSSGNAPAIALAASDRAAAERGAGAATPPGASSQSIVAMLFAPALGASTSAHASRPTLAATLASAPLASTSNATSSTARSSALHWLAASSSPAAKLASNAVSALLASRQPVAIVQ